MMTEPSKKPRVEDLSPQAAKIIEEKKTSEKLRLKQWFKLLGELAHFDEIGDEARSGATMWMGIFIVGIVLAVIAAIVIGANTDGAWWLIGALVGVGCLVGAIVFGMKSSSLKKIDLNNDFRLLVVPFLQTIAEDIEPNARVFMELDMSGVHEGKIVKKGEIPPQRWKKVTETVYSSPWCKVEAPLVGGSKLLLTVEDTYISHEREWRNPRGKYKSKTKWKKLVQVTAGLAPNADLMGVDQGQVQDAGGREKLKLSEKGDGQLVRLTRKFKFTEVNAEPEETVDPDELVGMFFQVGTMLAQAKSGS